MCTDTLGVVIRTQRCKYSPQDTGVWIQDNTEYREYRVWIQPTRYSSVNTGHHRIQKLQLTGVWIQDNTEYRGADNTAHRIQSVNTDHEIQKCEYRTP